MNPSNLNHTQLLQAQTHIWSHIFNYLNSMSLKCAIDLGIPDVIHNQGGNPMTIPQLVAALPISPTKASCLDRLMRILTHSGFFEHKQEGYVLTNTSLLLLKDENLSLAPFLKFLLDPVLTKPADCLGLWFQNCDPSPFHTAHGKGIWDYASNDAKLGNLLNDAMASDSQLVSGVIIEKCKWVFEGLSSLVDVGGGTGILARAISEAFPAMDCIVFDLPRVVDSLEGGKNLKFVGGSMFDDVPPADAVLLKWILHDWSDEECVKILRRCKEAIVKENKKGGKVIIIDMVMRYKNEDYELVETQLFFDILMMMYASGKERNEENWAKLFSEAGFSGYKISPILGSRSLIEVYLEQYLV